MTKRLAYPLEDVLAGAGVRCIYGVSGDSLGCITDAIRAKKQVEWIAVGEEDNVQRSDNCQRVRKRGLRDRAQSC